MRKTICILGFLFLFAIGNVLAADTVLTWPADGKNPIVRVTVGKLRQVSSNSGQNDYLGEALAENLSGKPIPSASFYLYLIDKGGKRVGEGYLRSAILEPGRRRRFQ